MDKCIWIEGIGPPSQHHLAGGSSSAASNTGHLISNGSSSSSAANAAAAVAAADNNATPAQWLSTLAQSSTWSDNLGAAFAEQNTQALLSRIASLEASLAEMTERLKRSREE